MAGPVNASVSLLLNGRWSPQCESFGPSASVLIYSFFLSGQLRPLKIVCEAERISPGIRDFDCVAGPSRKDRTNTVFNHLNDFFLERGGIVDFKPKLADSCGVWQRPQTPDPDGARSGWRPQRARSYNYYCNIIINTQEAMYNFHSLGPSTIPSNLDFLVQSVVIIKSLSFGTSHFIT